MAPRATRRPAPAVVGVRARTWLAHGTTALAVSALALGLASSLTPTSSAEVRPPAPARTAQPAVPPPDPSVLEPYRGADTTAEPLRQALVAERAAQRAEQLAKAADAANRASAEAGEAAREQGLSRTDRATRAKAAELARQALAEAVAAREAAVAARLAAEAAAAAAASGGLPAGAADPGAATDPVPPLDPATAGPAVSPVPGAVITSRWHEYGSWSRYHTGVDFRAARGVPIKAVKAGRVLYAGSSGNWAGNHVAVLHADGSTSMSSHMASVAVAVGQSVQAGHVIGYVGDTGRAFGAHLHFEVYPAGVRYGDVYHAVDPVPWLDAAGVATG